MTDAVHDRHWRLAIPRDHDRIARPWPSRFQPAPEFFAEVIRPRRVVDREVGRRGAPRDLVDILGRKSIHGRIARSVGDQSAGVRVSSQLVPNFSSR
jgi:hypothetical protein